ncbi:hypothetical protein [Candidatus Endomicrobiellum agilis]|uniref:hypothetical protein n=1 Tax=Candidatus Endomicrobiellum agilis TaxID=3238957 RepID=UPI003576391F|nr:hypothetical protein [Endomicrobium sp.]
MKKLLIIILALCMSGCQQMRREPAATASPEAPVIVVDNAEVLAEIQSLKTNAKAPNTNEKTSWHTYAYIALSITAIALLSYFGYHQWCKHAKYRALFIEANAMRNKYGFEGGEKYKMGMQIQDLQNELKISMNQYKTLKVQLTQLMKGDDNAKYEVLEQLQSAQKEISNMVYLLRCKEEEANEYKQMLGKAQAFCDYADQIKLLNDKLTKEKDLLSAELQHIKANWHNPEMEGNAAFI